MKQVTAFGLMEELQHSGWCVVIKCLPKELGWIIEGSRSEYDAPCPDTTIGKGKWVCEAQWLGGEPYRHREFAMAETPLEAVRKVYFQVWREGDRIKARERLDQAAEKASSAG